MWQPAQTHRCVLCSSPVLSRWVRDLRWRVYVPLSANCSPQHKTGKPSLYLLRGFSSATFSLSLTPSLRFLEPVLDALRSVALSATVYGMAEGPATGSSTAGGRLNTSSSSPGVPMSRGQSACAVALAIFRRIREQALLLNTFFSERGFGMKAADMVIKGGDWREDGGRV